MSDEEQQIGERRSLERRVDMLERRIHELDMQTAVMQATLNGLVSTMDSRHKAFERGQDLILKDIEAIRAGQIKIEADLKAPQDLSKLSFSPGVVVAIVATVLSIIGAQQAATWGIKSDVKDISTNQAILSKTLDGVAKKQELQQLEIQSLRETILNQRRQP